jgi:hypothetical protein
MGSKNTVMSKNNDENLPIAQLAGFSTDNDETKIKPKAEPTIPLENIKEYYKAIERCDINKMEKLEYIYPKIYTKSNPFEKGSMYKYHNPLLHSIKYNRLPVVKHLSKYSELFMTNNPSALSDASEYCLLDIMKYLLDDNGFKVDSLLAESCYEFAIMGGNTEIMTYLEDVHDWNPFINEHYVNPLILAVTYNQYGSYEYIRKKYPDNYDIHVTDLYGDTIYENAVVGGCHKIIEELDTDHDFYNKYIKHKEKNKKLNLFVRSIMTNGVDPSEYDHIDTRTYLIEKHGYKPTTEKEYKELKPLYISYISKKLEKELGLLSPL